MMTGPQLNSEEKERVIKNDKTKLSSENLRTFVEIFFHVNKSRTNPATVM